MFGRKIMNNAAIPLVSDSGAQSPKKSTAWGYGFLHIIIESTPWFILAFFARTTHYDFSTYSSYREFGLQSYVCIAIGIFHFI